MSNPRTSREALIAEALGEVGRMLDQVRTLQAAMNASRQALAKTHEEFCVQASQQRTAFEAQMSKLSEKAKTHVAAHIVAQADEVYRRKVQEQDQQIRKTIRVLLAAELDSAAQRSLATAGRAAKPGSRCESWLTHLAVAAAASTLTLVCMSIVPLS